MLRLLGLSSAGVARFESRVRHTMSALRTRHGVALDLPAMQALQVVLAGWCGLRSGEVHVLPT